MEYSELYLKFSDMFDLLSGPDGFVFWSVFIAVAGLIFGFFVCLVMVLAGDLMDIVHAAVPLLRRSINERKSKKSGKLTNEQHLELIEQKLDCIADVVISSSPVFK